jgi:hypothetical protein
MEIKVCNRPLTYSVAFLHRRGLYDVIGDADQVTAQTPSSRRWLPRLSSDQGRSLAIRLFGASAAQVRKEVTHRQSLQFVLGSAVLPFLLYPSSHRIYQPLQFGGLFGMLLSFHP